MLVTAFNRPDLTRKVIDSLRAYRPQSLYLACDGPREGNFEDSKLIAQVREELLSVDWPCSISTKFEASNLGLHRAMVSAIDWFFALESEGIVLEDDCIPHRSFFDLMEFVLEEYRDRKEVWGATGWTPVPKIGSDSEAFFFVGTALIWGWASWADRWRLYDRDLSLYKDGSFSRNLKKWPDAYVFHALDWHLRRLAKSRKPYSWAYQWAWTVVFHGGLWVVPRENMVENLGFRGDATNTHRLRKGPAASGLNRPISAPKELTRSLQLQMMIHRAEHSVFYPLQMNYVRDIIRDLRTLLMKIRTKVNLST